MFGRKKVEQGAAEKRLLVMVASDIHGSDMVWKKFLNASKQFDVDVLLMNGDLAGKILVPAERRGSGWVVHFEGRPIDVETDAELHEIFDRARVMGQYPYVAEAGEIQQLRESQEYLEQVFRRVIRGSVTEWMEIAAARLKDSKTRLFVMPGNDDPADVAQVLTDAGVENPEGQIIDIDGQHQMVALGYSNITPWKTPRELEEPEIRKRLEHDFAEVTEPALTIGAIHCPPFDSGLDTAPALDENFRVVHDTGQPRMTAVGSPSVREVIEKYQPLVSLHGHIHESAGARKIGTTVAINPGSEYGDGTLKATLVSIKGARVLGHQFING